MDCSIARDGFDYEVERETIIRKIQTICLSADNKKCILNLYGESGTGKSVICKCILKSNTVVPKSHKVLIDFNQISNKSIPGIIEGIIENLGYASFVCTCRELKKYYISIDASKAEVLRQCTATFVFELNEFAEKQRVPVLLIFDTYEALPTDIQNKEFQHIIMRSHDNIVFLIAGISKMNYDQCKSIKVDGFSEDEVQSYFINRDPRMKSTFRKHGRLLASRIRDFTNEGNPILCGLLSDCIQRCRDIDEQINYLLDGKKDASYQLLVSWLANLETDLQSAIRLTAYFNDRMTPELLSEISRLPIEVCRGRLQEMLNFSFVKNFSEIDNANPQIVLHDVVAKLIKRYYSYNDDELHELAERAVVAYDKLIAQDRNNIEAFQEGTALRIERILSMVKNGSFDKALILFDGELINALDEFDYSFAAQLTAEVELFNGDCSDIRWNFITLVARSEYMLRQYDIDSAIIVLNRLRCSELYTQPLYKAIADSVHGRLLVNPCTTDVEESLDDAINILTSSTAVLIKRGLGGRAIKVNYWLGIAYLRTGQNDLACRAFEAAQKLNPTSIQKVDILLEMSKMVRLQQDVQGALKPLDECDLIMITQDSVKNKNKGKYFYYKGNVYRDLGKNDLAVSFYNQAFSALKTGDDDFTLCELNLDYAWLEYLRRDDISLEQLRHYLDAGWELAQKYQFGTEFSEYHHILYEIEHYLGDNENADSNLRKALEYAYKYSNIYMILDCLNHMAQMHYRKEEFDKIPRVIKEMEKIEETGCKIRVFRGRARLIQADVYYKEGRFDKALEEYFAGFLIVALYGNSYTNVELFDDLYSDTRGGTDLPRKEKIKLCLVNLPRSSVYIRRFKRTWHRQGVNRDYDYFIENMSTKTT